jgi:hypothetical protein
MANVVNFSSADPRCLTAVEFEEIELERERKRAAEEQKITDVLAAVHSAASRQSRHVDYSKGGITPESIRNL